MDKHFLGFGLGLRAEYYEPLLQQPHKVDWFEILSENYLVAGGKPLYYLDRFAEQYPIAMHGVSMNLGSTDPLDKNYLRELKALADRVNPVWISDHLCWTGVNGLNTHDLLPLPYHEESIEHVARRIHQVQDFLERPFLIENLSSYVCFNESSLTEWQFISEICERADCGLLLDINNIYVSSRNQGFEPMDYLHGVPPERVWQHHLAGHTDYGDHVIDTHDAAIVDPVWALYEEAVRCFGPISTLIERDDRFPPLESLLEELQQAREHFSRAQTSLSREQQHASA